MAHQVKLLVSIRPCKSRTSFSDLYFWTQYYWMLLLIRCRWRLYRMTAWLDWSRVETILSTNRKVFNLYTQHSGPIYCNWTLKQDSSWLQPYHLSLNAILMLLPFWHRHHWNWYRLRKNFRVSINGPNGWVLHGSNVVLAVLAMESSGKPTFRDSGSSRPHSIPSTIDRTHIGHLLFGQTSVELTRHCPFYSCKDTTRTSDSIIISDISDT